MKRKGEIKKSLNESSGNMTNKIKAQKKRKLMGSRGRYFGKKIEEVEDDEKAKRNDTNDNSDESDVKADHQDDGSDNDSGSGSSNDEDSGNKDIGGIKRDGGIKRNRNARNDDVDESESNEEGDTGNDNESEDSGSGSEENDEDEESAKNSEDEMPSTKLNKSNKQHNGSPVVKKGTKPIQQLPKFQGTTKASEQIQQTDFPTIKRKRPNKDETENEIFPAKKPRAFDEETQSSVDKRKEERNTRSLFLKNLPPNTTVEVLKKLSPDIIGVRIPLEGKKNAQNLYAFIEFESEEAADKNYKRMMQKTIDNTKITVDYCGEKSSYRKAPKQYAVNTKKLFIPSLPMDVTTDELKQYFPEAKSFVLKQRGSKRLVFMLFENESMAKKAFEENEKLTVHGKKLTVLFAFKKKHPKVNVMRDRKRAKIVPSLFEDEDNTGTTKGETKNESNKKLNETTEATEEGKKSKRRKKKKKNPKVDNEATKMETDANEELETSTETSKVKKRNFKKKNKKIA